MLAMTVLPKHSQILHEIESTDFWAARYNTWLLIKVMAKHIVFSFLVNRGLSKGLWVCRCNSSWTMKLRLGAKPAGAALCHIFINPTVSHTVPISPLPYHVSPPPHCVSPLPYHVSPTFYCVSPSSGTHHYSTIPHGVSPFLTVFHQSVAVFHHHLIVSHHPSLCYTIPHCVVTKPPTT